MSASQFAGSAKARRRYWARSYFGYEHYGQAAPNRAHQALAALHNNLPSQFPTHITQNVDNLLQRAGGRPNQLIELHGTLAHVVCNECGAQEHRPLFQQRLVDANANMPKLAVPIRPDGDAEVPDAAIEHFVVPSCASCGADALAPGVVFHGGSIPRNITLSAREAVDDAQVVWVIGSTLTTYSSFSLVKRAKENGSSVIAVNVGSTRADDLFDAKFPVVGGDTVQRVADVLLDGYANEGRENTNSRT